MMFRLFKKNDYKSIKIEKVEDVSLFPKLAAYLPDFSSEENLIYRDNLIAEGKDLPFAKGYLYGLNGVCFDNLNDLVLFNKGFIDTGAYELLVNYYSIDGIAFKKLDDAVLRNNYLLDIYAVDFGWKDSTEFNTHLLKL